VFGEVAEVLGVQSGEGEVEGEAGGGDPRVVLRAGAAPAAGMGGDLAPDAGDIVCVRERRPCGESGLEFAAATGSPLAHKRPAGQLPECHERDADLGADELAE
jgi:hypothetical protein